MKKKSRSGPWHGRETKSKSETETGSAPARPSRHDAFLHLSRVLTAHELDAGLVEPYLERTGQAVGPQLDALLDRFQALLRAGRDPVTAVREHILPDQVAGPIARIILLLWYTGGIQASAGGDWQIQSADQYYRALVWEAIGAHAPTLSNGYFGHWKYPPEM